MDDQDSGRAHAPSPHVPSVTLAGDTSPVVFATGEEGASAPDGASACGPPPRSSAGRGRQSPTWFSARLARAITQRVAAGESLWAVCEAAGMPHRASVYRWVKQVPRFAEALRLARERAKRGAKAALAAWCPLAAQEICERLCEGETLAAICSDPTLPAYSTVYRWRRNFPEFADQFDEARQVQAERLADEGLDLVRKLPADAPYAAHVRLTQLRWMAGVLSPRVMRVKLTEPPKEPQLQTVQFRHFRIEEDLEAGLHRVVGYTPDWETQVPKPDSRGEWTPIPEAELAAARRSAAKEAERRGR